MSETRKKSVVVATRGVAFRDFLVFQVKLALEGFRDLLAINLSVIAIVVDILSGQGRRPRRFYTVVRWSRRFDGWLRLHSMKGMRDAEEEGSGVAGGHAARRVGGRDVLGSGNEAAGSGSEAPGSGSEAPGSGSEAAGSGSEAAGSGGGSALGDGAARSHGTAPRDERRLGSDADTLVEQFEELVRKTQRRAGGSGE